MIDFCVALMIAGTELEELIFVQDVKWFYVGCVIVEERRIISWFSEIISVCGRY